MSTIETSSFDGIDASPDLSAGQPRGNVVARFQAFGVLHQLTICIEHQGIAAIENGDRRKRFQSGSAAIKSRATSQQASVSGGRQACSLGIEPLADGRQALARVIVPDSSRSDLPPATTPLQKVALRSFQAKADFIKPLLAPVDTVHHSSESALLRPLAQFLPSHKQTVTDRPIQPAVQIFSLAFDFLTRTDDEFGSSRRSWRTQVGDEIDDREISFVTDRRDDRNLRSRDRPRKSFVIERRKIFCRAATARDDDDLDRAHAVEVMKPSRDLDGSRFSLHLRRIDQHAGGMMAARKNVQDVPHRRTLRRSDDPDQER